MYKINSKEDKPDINYLFKRASKMMNRGISVGDIDALYNKFNREQEAIAAEMRMDYGILNPRSPKQIIGFISGLENSEVYDVCCIDGNWTSDKNSMSTLASKGYKFASDIINYRLIYEYAKSMKCIKEAIEADGRIHPDVSLTKTNRVSYTSPALMNIPKTLLWNVVRPNKSENILISADIKNQEPSILINILNTKNLKEVLKDSRGLYESLYVKPFSSMAKLNFLVVDGTEPGHISNKVLADVYKIPPVYYTPSLPLVDTTYYKGKKIKYIDQTNVVVKPGTKEMPKLPETVLVEDVDGVQYEALVEWDNVDVKKFKNKGIVGITGQIKDIDILCEGNNRKEFKVAWNAMTYGASLYGVKAICKHIDGSIVYNYFSKIAELKEYRDRCKKLADMGQQAIKTYFGTLLIAGKTNPSELKRTLMDLPIQGTASDILSLLVKHCDEEIQARGLEGKLELYYTRHDEIIFEVDREWKETIGIEAVMDIIRDMVEHQVDDWVPFKVEVSQVEKVEICSIENDEE